MQKVMLDVTDDINVLNDRIQPKPQVTKEAGGEEQAYSPDVCNQLWAMVEAARLTKRYRKSRYEVGDMIKMDLVGICPDSKFQAIFRIEKFVGGGFAGQVYKVKLIEVDSDHQIGTEKLELGKSYAMKILVPPSRFSVLFRNLIYWLAYQGPFAAQVNFAAARVGVLWLKLIQRAAKLFLGSEHAIVNTYGTFFDKNFNSYGEINEWVPGRTWKFEIDDRIFERKKWRKLDFIPKDGSVNSVEYLTKRKFMEKLVKLLHEMGAPELARQYEWATMKSQPNVLKRNDSDDGYYNGLVAIDFRAGLALLPFLPMSPADFRLIIQGILRGNLVQFDRGDLNKLSQFIQQHQDEFRDLKPAYEELLIRESEYRGSLPDIFHQGFQLILKKSLRKTVKQGLISGWKCKDLLDDQQAEKVAQSSVRFILFYLLGIFPIVGNFIRRLWGNRLYAKHIKQIFTESGYFGRTLRAKQAKALIDWYRDGRIVAQRAFRLVHTPVRFWLQWFLLSWLPPKWHRFFTDGKYAWSSFKYAVTYPVRFYRDADFREAWLLQQVEAGYQEGMLTDQEADSIRANIKDVFVQKYLKCVAVHVATLPITQIVSGIAALYAMIRFGKTWSEGLLYAGAILAAFQATPVSPGSLVRGSYVLYLMIKERDVKNYWIAAMISFWHYVGYLGFPVQMVAKFPALSRLMAGRWATNIVHIIPVFGERGALLEHWVFDLFFNVPISIRRMFGQKKRRQRLS